MAKRILVTGGNVGIGFALCKSLTIEHGCHVYLGSRSLEKGQAAIKSIIKTAPQYEKMIELLQVDVMSDISVLEASKSLKVKNMPLYAIVNNAGSGFSHGVSKDTVMQTNLYGVKRTCEAFIPMLDPKKGRIVNVGSGAGPMWLMQQNDETKNLLSNPNVTWEQIDQLVKTLMRNEHTEEYASYGLSKACLHAYTMSLAKMYPNFLSVSLSPGFIATAMTKGMGASKTPEEGTLSIRHCLFTERSRLGNGYFYGSDCKRSPLTITRDPGTPEYTGDGEP